MLLRLTRPLFLNRSSYTKGFGVHCMKQTYRQTKESKFDARLRAQHQRERFSEQQSINQAFGEQQRAHAKVRRQLTSQAYGILSEASSKAPLRPQDRADKMAAARHLLQLQEVSRKEMKRGRTRRTEAFRSTKRWMGG